MQKELDTHRDIRKDTNYRISPCKNKLARDFVKLSLSRIINAWGTQICNTSHTTLDDAHGEVITNTSQIRTTDNTAWKLYVLVKEQKCKIRGQIKNDSETKRRNEKKILAKCHIIGDLKPIWAELKRKRNGIPGYISELYTDDNHNKHPINSILANLTKHVNNTFYRNYERGSLSN